jgi:hypothetical protein
MLRMSDQIIAIPFASPFFGISLSSTLNYVKTV